MKEVIKSARTVAEAVQAALQELQASQEEVAVEVLSEPTKGLFGLVGGKPAVVRVTLRETVGTRARVLVESVLGAMGLTGEVSVFEDGEGVHLEIRGEKMGVLIGRRGETLNALQYLVGLAVNRSESEKRRVQLDVEGYRKKREETLRELALKLAEKAKRRGRNVVLEPMSSQERRVIHMALKGRNDIYTFSEGEEPFRKIVISPRR